MTGLSANNKNRSPTLSAQSESVWADHGILCFGEMGSWGVRGIMLAQKWAKDMTREERVMARIGGMEEDK